MRTSVYLLYGDGGALLYVGMSRDPFSRFSQHSDKDWRPFVRTAKYKWYDDRARAALAERRFIRRLQPRFNSNHKGIKRASSDQPILSIAPVRKDYEPLPIEFQPDGFTGVVWGWGAGQCEYVGKIFSITPSLSNFKRLERVSTTGDVVIVTSEHDFTSGQMSQLVGREIIYMCGPRDGSKRADKKRVKKEPKT